MGQTWLITLVFGLHPPFYESTLCALSSEIMSPAWKSLENCAICAVWQEHLPWPSGQRGSGGGLHALHPGGHPD